MKQQQDIAFLNNNLPYLLAVIVLLSLYSRMRCTLAIEHLISLVHFSGTSFRILKGKSDWLSALLCSGNSDATWK